MQGWRKSMEDAHICEINLGDGNAFFGVFDGHGGKFKLNFVTFLGSEVAQFVKKHYVKKLLALPSYK